MKIEFIEKNNGFLEKYLKNVFFDSLRNDYEEFDKWYLKSLNCKTKESFYWIENSNNEKIISFLAIKKENEEMQTKELGVIKEKKSRLKIATIKSEKQIKGFSEFVIKKTCSIAIKNKINEIYFSIIPNNDEKQKLIEIFKKYGFVEIAKTKWDSKGKHKRKNEEIYLLKDIENYDERKTLMQNYPLYNKKAESFILVIDEKYHDNYLNESELQNFQNSFDPLKMGIKKVFVHNNSSWEKVKEDTLILIYRKSQTNKRYKSVITSVGRLVKNYKKNKDYENFEDFKKVIKNYHAFESEIEIKRWYEKNQYFLIFEYLEGFGKGHNKYNWIKLNKIGLGNLNALRLNPEQTEKIITESKQNEPNIITY